VRLIKTTEQLPADRQEIFFHIDHEWHRGYINNYRFYAEYNYVDVYYIPEVDYWMPLPEIPENKND
jgi:hypothetical protein